MRLQCLQPPTADDLYIARRLFQLEIYQRNAQDYENLFSKVMRLHNVDFIQIKPQGQFGDRKMMTSLNQPGNIIRYMHRRTHSIKKKKL